MLRFIRRHPILTLFLLLVLAAVITVRIRMQGPYRDYRVQQSWISRAPKDAPLLAGVAQRDITPDLTAYDPWTDADGDSKFDPDRGDTYEDRNGNGDFDFVWLGGFSANRPAQGINDPLSSRALALRHGDRTVVLVTIDSVGLTHERLFASGNPSISPNTASTTSSSHRPTPTTARTPWAFGAMVIFPSASTIPSSI